MSNITTDTENTCTIQKKTKYNCFCGSILQNKTYIIDKHKKSKKHIEYYNEQKDKINIKNITDLIYIGDIVEKNTNSKNKWKLEYKCNKNIQTKENGRIYLIIVDGDIYKIGASECKGGIKNTFNFYEGGLGGSPSIRTYGIHLLIQEQLNLGKKIQIYVLFIEPIKVIIKGLKSSIEKITYPQIKEMEDLCREDYKKIYGRYPKWNFQENAEEWSSDIKRLYHEHNNKRKIKN
jgi:hypothetical protein